MPTLMHECLVELFRDRPALAASLLADPLRITVPGFEQAHLSSNELNDVRPTEYRADAVVALTVGERDVGAVVVEIQLSRDGDKRRTWPAYVTTLYARLGCPVTLLVVCTDPGVASWCRRPIAIGHPGLVLTPLVLGPDQLPIVTDPVVAQQSPELAVMSAIVHGTGSEQNAIFDALLSTVNVLAGDRYTLYLDMVLELLPPAAKSSLEGKLSTSTRPYSEFARNIYDQGEVQGEARGEARGEAQAVLRVLATRGIEVPDQVRAEIMGCTDIERLETWLDRAIFADKVDEIFR